MCAPNVDVLPEWSVSKVIGLPELDFNEAVKQKMVGWQWHQLDNYADNHWLASTLISHCQNMLTKLKNALDLTYPMYKFVILCCEIYSRLRVPKSITNVTLIICNRFNAVQLSLCRGRLSPVWTVVSQRHFLIGSDTEANGWRCHDTYSWTVTSTISAVSATESASGWEVELMMQPIRCS